MKTAKFWSVILAYHTSPEEAGRIFKMAKPKMAAFTHNVILTNGKVKPPSLKDLTECARTTYSGPLVAGLDRMRFVVDKDAARVGPPPKKKMKK